jgi:elongation factor Ts
MAEITATLVKTLRDATNVSMMECKRALIEAEGDIGAATRLLRERGMAVAAKKASRAANQGIVASAASEDDRCSSLIEVNCETDFVARNETFQAFVADLARRALTTDGALAETVKDEVTAKVAEIGENIIVRRNARFTLQGNGVVASYIHLGGKVGVLVELGCDKPETAQAEMFRELARDLTLHVAAANPRYLKADDVPPEEIDSERAIFAKQVEGKPAAIIEKIVDGKIRKFYEEICLLNQGFVKEPKQAVTDLVAACGKALGDTLVVIRFVRYQLGA